MLAVNIHVVHKIILMNDLKTYLVDRRLRQADFAERLGITQATVSRLAAKTALPSLELAFAIERETGGAVPAASWLPAPTPTQEDAA
jgi:transcriptional regulator with XRE-family HTH domain